jgi:hypothetical protein
MTFTARLIYIYRAFILVDGIPRHVRFDSFVRELSNDIIYDCVDTESKEVYHIKGADLIGPHIFNTRILEKSA